MDRRTRAHPGPSVNGRGRITVNQAKFAEEYTSNGSDGLAAYRVAYPRANHSPGPAKERVRELLANPRVQAYLAEMARYVDAKLTQQYDASVERIALELCRIGFADPAGVFDPKTGNLLTIEAMPENVRRAISSIKVMHQRDPEDPESFVQVTEIRFWDKNSALGNLAKWKKMLIDRKEIGGPGEFDGMSDEEINRELANMEARDAILRARTKAAEVPARPKTARQRVGDEHQK